MSLLASSLFARGQDQLKKRDPRFSNLDKVLDYLPTEYSEYNYSFTQAAKKLQKELIEKAKAKTKEIVFLANQLEFNFSIKIL